MKKFLIVVLILIGCARRGNHEPLYNCYENFWNIEDLTIPVVYYAGLRDQKNLETQIKNVDRKKAEESVKLALDRYYKDDASGCRKPTKNAIRCWDDYPGDQFNGELRQWVSFFCLPVEYDWEFAQEYVEKNVKSREAVSKMFPLDND